MKTLFENLINNYYSFIKEQDNPPPESGVPTQGNMSTMQPPVNNKSVSQGYAHMVDTIFQLLKYKTENIPQKYYNLSDNEVNDSNKAYRYINILTRLLPQNTISDLKNDDLGKEKEGVMSLDDSTLVEMANTAIKALFYADKDNFEFSSKIEDIQNLISNHQNRITVDNANSVYQEIKSFISMQR